jgi:hypothetical protein
VGTSTELNSLAGVGKKTPFQECLIPSPCPAQGDHGGGVKIIITHHYYTHSHLNPGGGEAATIVSNKRKQFIKKYNLALFM